MRWRASGNLPANAAHTTSASKCTPSAPWTATRAPGRPASISFWMVSAFMGRLLDSRKLNDQV